MADDDVDELQDIIDFGALLAENFGWDGQVVHFLQNHLFGEAYVTNDENQIYAFRVVENEMKTFRFHAIDDNETVIERNFVAELDLEHHHVIVCSHGDEWQLIGGDGVNSVETVVYIITTNQPHQGDLPIFDHKIPVITPFYNQGFRLLCKPGCLYVCVVIRLGNADDDVELENHLAVHNIPIEIAPTVEMEEMEVEIRPLIPYIFRIAGDPDDIGYLPFADILLVPDLIPIELEE